MVIFIEECINNIALNPASGVFPRENMPTTEDFCQVWAIIPSLRIFACHFSLGMPTKVVVQMSPHGEYTFFDRDNDKNQPLESYLSSWSVCYHVWCAGLAICQGFSVKLRLHNFENRRVCL